MTMPVTGKEKFGDPPATNAVDLWQRKLLPYMSRFLVALALVFFLVSGVGIYELRHFVATDAGRPVRADVKELIQPKPDGSENAAALPQGLLLLEADALDKRYRQASSILLSRIWTRQLAFLTGMVLAFIGSVFIIGKLSETASDVNFGHDAWKAGISSSSPGLILAFFGTVLMAIALIVQSPIDIQDHPIYFVTLGLQPSESSSAAESPKPSPNPFQKKDEKVQGAKPQTK